MAAVHPDTIAAKRYRDSIDAFSGGNSLIFDRHFYGHVTGRINGDFTNDEGQNAIMDLRGIKVVVYDNDNFSNDVFGEGATDANGNFDIAYDRYQDYFEGSTLELFVMIYSENANTHIHVMKPDYVKYVNDDPYELMNWIGDVGAGAQTTDLGTWQLSSASKDPFKLLHWATCGVQFVNQNVGYYSREDLNIYPYSDGGTSNFLTIPFHNISLQSTDVSHETIIWHELGHYIMQNFSGISPFASGEHFSTTESNFMLAWSEGWATGFMAILDQYYRDLDHEYGWYSYFENQQATRYNLEARWRMRLNGGNASNGLRSEYNISYAIYDLYDGAGKFVSTEPQSSFRDFSTSTTPLLNEGYNVPFDDDVELSAYQIFKPLIDAKNAGNYTISSVESYYTLLNHSLDCDYPRKIQKVFTQNGILDNTNNQQSLTDILSSDDIGIYRALNDSWYLIPLAGSYCVEANLISSSSTLTSFYFNATQANETNFIADPLTINNGGKLGINANTGTALVPLAGSNMTVNLCNQIVTIGANGLIEIGNTSAYGKLVIDNNGILRIQSGGQLNINKNSKVVLKNGGKIIFENNAHINIQDYEAMIEIQDGGKIEVGSNATFKWTGDGSLKIVADPAHLGTPNILATTPNTNAKVEIRALYPGKTQKVIEIASGSLSIDKSISDVKIISGKIVMGQSAMLDVEPPLYMSDLYITSGSSNIKHSGIWVYGQQSTVYINYCIIENADAGIRVHAAKGISNVAAITNSKFINCSIGILVYGKGAEITRCIFDGKGQGIAVSLNSVENTCLIENTSIYNCVRGIDVIGSFSNLINVKSCYIPGNSTTGVFSQNVVLAPGCNTIINNFTATNKPLAIGNNINLSNYSYLGMEPAIYPGTGNNNLSSSKGKCIETNLANFLYMNLANTDLNAATNFSVLGTLKPIPFSLTKYPNIKAAGNYWWTPYSSPNNGTDYSVQYYYHSVLTDITIDGSPMLASSPVYSVCIPPIVGVDIYNNQIDPSAFYSKPSKSLESDIDIKAAFKTGLSTMYSSTPNYVSAFGYFNQIVSENYSTFKNIINEQNDTLSEFGLWYNVIDLSYIKMLECLSQAIVSGQIILNGTILPNEVQTVFNTQDHILYLLEQSNDASDIKFKIQTDRAMIYRLINMRTLALNNLISLNSMSLSLANMKQLQYFICIVEKEIHMIDGSISKSGYDSINTCRAVLDIPDNGAPDQILDVPDLDVILSKQNPSNGLSDQANILENEVVEFYPNPAQNIIYIKMPLLTTATKVDLLDITGRIITTQKVNNSTDIITLPIDVGNGTYLIQITTENSIIRKKVVIVK